MKFASVRLVTGDPASVDTLVSFYARLTGATATRPMGNPQEAAHAV